MKTLIRFFKRNAVFTIALAAMLITMFIVPPDNMYYGYFDVKTLVCLFCVLAVVCALKNVNFFYFLAKQIVKKFGNLRSCVIALVYITFIGSMLIANDMALLTFLPLGFFVLDTTGKRQYMAFTFIMQNIAANLGGMLTPFGNPQNLYLYTKFEIPTVEFMGIMFLPFIISIILITVCCIIYCYFIAFGIGYGYCLAILAVSKTYFNESINRHSYCCIAYTMIAMVCTFYYGSCIGSIGGGTTHCTIFGNSYTKMNGCTLYQLVGCEQTFANKRCREITEA